MHLYPKQVESSKTVIDVQKARNANELITILARINNNVRQHQRTFEIADKKTPIREYLSIVQTVLQRQEELKAAYVASTLLTDSKRDRCLNATKNLNKDLQELKLKVLSKVDKLSKPAISEEHNAFADKIYDWLGSKATSSYVMNIHDGKDAYIIMSLYDVLLPSGYRAPELFVKLKQDTGTSVCFPSSAFMDTQYYPFTTPSELKTLVFKVLDYGFDSKPVEVNKTKAVKLPGVNKVYIDNGVNILLNRDATGTDINTILRNVIPLVKKGIGADQFDVVHKTTPTPEGRVITFLLTEKNVIDHEAMNALYRLIKVKNTGRNKK